MKRRSNMVAAGLIALAALAGATPPVEVPVKDKAGVAAALERGRLLFELDRAAWITTDDMIERLGRRDAPIKGWVIERAAGGGGFAVTYFGDGAAGPVAWYAGAVRDGKIIAAETFAEGRRPPLTANQLRLKEAADAARAFTRYQPCTPSRFNVAVVPPESAAGPIEAYLLSAQTESNVYPLGGHYRLRIEGGKVVSHRRFMNICMNFDTKGASETPLVVALTHRLDPVPTEIHVWASLAMRTPVMVGTEKPTRIWLVEGSEIRLLDK